MLGAHLAGAQQGDDPLDSAFKRAFGQLRTQQEMILELPVIIDARQKRTIRARVAGDLSSVHLMSAPLLAALRERLLPDLYDRIANATDGEGYVPLSALREAGLEVEFDRSGLVIRLTVPPEASEVEVIRLRGGRPPAFAAAVVEPQAVSAFVNLRGLFDWIGTTSSPLKRGLQPVRVDADGAANLFDWVLEGGFTAEEDAEYPWVRKEVRLVRDLQERQIRLQAGDLVYEGTGFQRRQPMGGFGFGTNFDLQPYRVIEPSGSQEFTLDTPSEVDVIVNGRTIRSLQLLPGRYDIRDFHLGTGINDVVIRIRDKLGRMRELQFGLSFEPRLLAAGTSEFSFVVGAPTIEKEGLIRYDSDTFGYSLFHRYGLSDALTVGANVQGDDQRHMFGIEAVLASNLGTVRADVAASVDDDTDTGYAGRLQYDYYDGTTRNRSRRRWTLTVVARGRRFAGLGGAAPDNPTAYEFSGTMGQDFWSTGIRGNVSAVYALGRRGTPDHGTVSMSLRRKLFRDWEIELSLDRRFAAGEKDEESAFLTVTWSNRERNQTVRLDHDSTDHATQLEWRYTPDRAVGGTGLSLGAIRRPAEYEYTGGAQHVNTRFEAEVFHDASVAREADGLDEHRTSLRLATAFAFAGGAFAISRPISESFALVVRHPSLKQQTIGVDRAGGGAGAQIDGFGPAVLPNLIPYQIRTVSIDAPDLPPGFDLGEEFFEAHPTYRSGLLIRVGTDATAVLRGTLTRTDGQPVRLEGGTLSSLDDPRRSFSFFTNRKGRFSRGELRPGRYELRMYFAPERPLLLEIPEGTAGIYDVGELALPGS